MRLTEEQVTVWRCRTCDALHPSFPSTSCCQEVGELIVETAALRDQLHGDDE